MANPAGSALNENAEPSQPAAPLNPPEARLNPSATPFIPTVLQQLVATPQPAAPLNPAQLNPSATPFIPAALQQPAAPPEPHADSFCLFLTFSNGFPVTHQEVRDLFVWMCPDQVKSVYVNIPGPDGRPEELWGKVVFTNPYIADHLLATVPSHTLYPRRDHPMVFKRFDSNRANNNNPGGTAPPPPPPSPPRSQ